MSAVVARRYACRACGRVYVAWAPRCAICLAHQGLVAATEAQVSPTVSAQPAFVPAPPTEPVVDLPRPRLMIARAPSPDPDPDLEDPAEELADVVDDDTLIPLSEVQETTFARDSTGLPPLDHVLGGGLVVGSVVLLASPPGIGKSSLSLQMLDGLGHRCLYVTGEETKEQLAATARRIGAASNKIYPFVEQHIDKILAKARAIRAQTIAIDSIQKMLCDDVNSRAGSPAQLKECTARLVQFAKTTDTAVWIIGHVTSDGDVAGPRTLEHDVDVLLELEQGQKFEGNERIIRCPTKNRFGPTNVEGSFELTGKGFVSVDGDGWDEEL
jgi:predicted ATP-dependent serine protease